jgi:hypothetical protein
MKENTLNGIFKCKMILASKTIYKPDLRFKSNPDILPHYAGLSYVKKIVFFYVRNNLA